MRKIFLLTLIILIGCGTDHNHHDEHHHTHHREHIHGHGHDHGHGIDHADFEWFIEGERGYINIYSARHFEADEEMFRDFTEATGIGVNVIFAASGQIIERLRIEGEHTPASLVISADGGALSNGAAHGFFQPVTSPLIESQIPDNFRDRDNLWHGLSYRARVLAVIDEDIQNYQDLATEGKSLLLRPGNHIYNVSLLASLIDIYGYDYAFEWARAVNNNRARTPQGNDRDQAIALYAGLGNAALMNSYYLGLLLASGNPQEVAVGEGIRLIFPNQDTTGTHINISGMAVPYYAPNPAGAIEFIEFATSVPVQNFIADENYEFPVNPNARVPAILAEHVPFNVQDINWEALHQNHISAVEIMNIIGW